MGRAMSAATDILPITDRAALERCEAIIARGVQTFIEVGEALAEIREARLYRAGFATFEEYCRERWGIGGSRARQLIGAAGVARNIESVTTVTLSSETHARPLVGLAPDQQAAAATRAATLAGTSAPTAKHFQQAAAEITQPAPDLSDILLRLDAHGYARAGTRQKGMTTFYSFRDVRNDLDDDNVGVLELAEGELSYWLAELDTNAAYALQRQERFIDARDRAERLGYDLRRDGTSFVLAIAGQAQPALRGTLDAQIKTIEGYERNAAKQAAPPAPSAPVVPTLTELDALGMPVDLHNAGYYWHAADPPTIALNNSDRRWSGETIQQAIEVARAHMDAKGEPITVFPALTPLECKALIREVKQFIGSGLEKKLPTIGQALRIAGRMALEATE